MSAKGCIILFGSVFGGMVAAHETIHDNIWTYHGCQATKWGFDGIYASVRCLEWTGTDEMLRQAMALHAWNEIFGYYTFFIVLAILIGVIMRWYNVQSP